MPLEIFPQFVSLFPNDRQRFRARSIKPTDAPMWCNFSRCFVKPDYSVQHEPLLDTSNFSVDGAHHLESGVGSIEFKLTANSTPGVGQFNITAKFLDGGSGWFYVVSIRNPTTIADGDTLQHIPSVGDRFRIELASGFRLYINDVLRHERLVGFTGSVRYPATYRVQVFTPIGATPNTVPAPILRGDGWRLRPLDNDGDPVVTFLTPAHGSLDPGANALEKEYFDGTQPGEYKLIGRIDPALEVWVQDAAPAGSSVITSGGSWVFGASSPPPFSGNLRLKSPLAAGDHEYLFHSATRTLQIDKDDVLVCHVFLDATNPPTAIMFQYNATDATGLEHRAYWGANSFSQGINGTASRRFMGPLPPTGQWVRLEVRAADVDLEGRVLHGQAFNVFDGVCSFDLSSKYPGKLQYAESLIPIPPLKILGETVRMLQPESKTRILTNYQDARTPDLVAWSIVSGAGSISTDGEFTADDAPGTTVIRATSGDQVADLTINVPAIITPAFGFAAPLEQIDFETNIPPSVTWSSVPAGINSGTGVWTLPDDVGRRVRVSVTDGSFTAQLDILIVPTCPLANPTLPITRRRGRSALISMSEDRTSRIVREKAAPYDSYPVKYVARTQDEVQTICDFWDQQSYGKPFILEDPNRGVRLAGWFDSEIEIESRDECDNDISFRFLEARL
jgi:hypothetical protein